MYHLDCRQASLIEPSQSHHLRKQSSGNGGSDMYGAILMGCDNAGSNVPHVGQSNETSWYFDTPLMKHASFQ